MEEKIAAARELLENNPAKFQNGRKTIADIIAFLDFSAKRVSKGDLSVQNPDLIGFLDAVKDYLTAKSDELQPNADWDLVCEILDIGLYYE